MSVHYKFKSALEFDTVTFDGLHISVHELKKSILHQKRIGKNTDFDLQITNAQTKEVYTDDNTLIPKNTSLIVARVPLTAQQKKAWERSETNQQLTGISKVDNLNGAEPGVHRLAKATDLSSLDASEEEKIQAMMTQSTQDYNPSNYMKIRGSSQVGDVPPNYRCYRCFQPGHWIKNCPLGIGQENLEIKKSTGIPRSFMVPVEGPSVPGAMMTPSGQFAVPAIDHQAYKEGKKEKPPFQQEPEPVVEKPEIPEDLVCTICKDLLTDAVMIPCCGDSFCDECIRMVLLESEDHECPDCCEKDVSPETLIPNRFLRNAVNNFRNETGYNKRPSTLKEVPLVTSVEQSITTNVPVRETSVPNEDLNVPSLSHTILNPSKNIIEVIGASSVTSIRPIMPSEIVTTSTTVPISHPQISVPVPVSNGIPISNNGSFSHPSITVSHPIVSLAPPGVTDVTTHSVTAPLIFHGNGSSHSSGLLAPAADVIKHHAPEMNTAAPAPHHPVDQLKASVQPPGTVQDLHPAFVQEIGKVEERPGTPTIDECNTDVAVPIAITSTFPDTSVPPPNFAGDKGQNTFQQIQTRVGVPPVQSYRSEKSYIHRVTTQVLPARTVIPPVVRHTVPLLVPTPQPPPPAAGAYMPHPQYEHVVPPPGFPIDTTVRPYLDGQAGQRGAYRGGYRGRGRGFRGHPHNTYQQPLPPGVGGGRNENPPGTIDDPLEVFERMLREKDNRDRKMRNTRRSRSPRSLSRTRSRSRDKSASPRCYTPRSRTPTPPPRSRSVSRGRVARSPSPRPRSPPRKRSRSRSRTHSRSFTISRSRSHSFSRSLTPSPRHRSPLVRQYSPRRREEGSHYRSPIRTPPQSTRFQRSYKDAPIEYESGSSYYDNEYPSQYPAKRGGNFNDKGRGRFRKDYNKDYYNQNYNRYSENRYGTGRSQEDARNRPEQVLPHSSASTRYEPPTGYRHYDNYDIQPPGTGDIPIIRPYEKRYEHGYDRTGRKSRSPVDEYLAPPGVDVRPPEYSGRERDVLSSKDHEVVTSVIRDRNTRDIGIRDRDSQPSWDSKDRKVREQVNDLPRERERDVRVTDRTEKSKDWGRDVYETDYRYGYDNRSYGYVSPDSRHRKQSVSPVHQGNIADRFSSVDKHRHRNDSHGSRRKVQQSHTASQQSVEAVDVIDRHSDFDNQRDVDRERVLVELRRTTTEPHVEKVKKDKDDRIRKDDDKSKDKRSREKKRKKKERDLDSDKTKKKKKDKKEKKDTKKDMTENKTLTTESADAKSSINTEKSAVLKVIDTNKQIKEENAKTTKLPTINSNEAEAFVISNNSKAKAHDVLPHNSDLYGGLEEAKIDSDIIASYNTVICDVNDKKDANVEAKEAESIVKDIVENPNNIEEPGTQILKPNDVLAPLPELSKWELEDDLTDERIGEEKSVNSDGSDVIVTSEVLKRAENAIFQKAINAIRPNEGVKKPFSNPEKKVSSGTTEKEKKSVETIVKDTSDVSKKLPDKEHREAKKPASSIQVTIPIVGHTERSVEISSDGNGNKSKKLDRSKFIPCSSSASWRENLTSPHRVPAKERLGAKLEADDDRKEDRNHKYVYNRSSAAAERKHGIRKGLKSTVERKRTKSRSRSPFHRKMFANRKDPKFPGYMKDGKYLEALEMRRFMESERRVIDPGLEKKYFEQTSKRDIRYIEPERFAGATAVRDRHHVEKRGYSPEKRRDQTEGHDRPTKREEREKSPEKHKGKHKLKKKTKVRESRKKSVSDRESKRGKKKDKKHKKEKSKKQKVKGEKDDKITESNATKDKENSGHIEGNTKAESVPSKINSEKSSLRKEDTHKDDVEKKTDRKNPKLATDRKKSTLDEASFEPDYDASSSLDSDIEEVRETQNKTEHEEKKIESEKKSENSTIKKHEKSKSSEEKGKKHQKVEKPTDADTNKSKKNSATVKKREKPSSSEEDSSDDSSEDESSSDSSSDTDESSDDSSSRRKRKKKASKKRKRKKVKRSKRADTTSESESESDSDDEEDDSSSDSDSIPSRRRKHKHHSKAKRKKKKSRHR